MKALVIYSNVPSNVRAYSIDVTNEEMKQKLKLCHGQYTNLQNTKEQDTALLWLDDLISGMKPIFDDENLITEIDIKQFDLIIITGFME